MEQTLQSTEATVEPTRRKRRKRRHNLVRALPTMKPILDYLHVSGEIFSRKEIMGHLTEYIKQKCLFDPEDPRKVYCENDELGVIFGCKEFSIANACELLLCNLKELNNFPPPWNSSSHDRNCQLVSLTCSCSESDQQYTNEVSSSRNPVPSTSNIILKDMAGSKRRHNDACPDTSERPLGEYGKHYKHVSGDVTDVVTDTSDDLFFLNETDEVSTEITDEDTFLEEYEPISSEERFSAPAARETDEVSTEFTDEDTFLEEYEPISSEERLSAPAARDDDTFLEEYEPISYSDEERLIAYQRGAQYTEDAGGDGGDELDDDSEIEDDDKWQCESCTLRNHPMTRHCRRCWAMRKNRSNPVSEASVSDCATTSHNMEQEGDDYWGNGCYICNMRPRDGCIVHGQTGHQVCCVGCAKRLKEQRKPCPVCHKKIHRVIQNFL